MEPKDGTLSLTRKAGESIQVGDDITVTIVDIHAGRVRLGIKAPQSVRILRTELLVKNQQGGGDNAQA